MKHNSSHSWHIKKQGKGIFVDSSLETVQFIPTQSGNFDIQLIANPLTACNVANAYHQFDVAEPVVLSTLPVSAICENAMAQISATASNYQSITWSKVTGNGTLNNSTTLTPIYTPATADTKVKYKVTVNRK